MIQSANFKEGFCLTKNTFSLKHKIHDLPYLSPILNAAKFPRVLTSISGDGYGRPGQHTFRRKMHGCRIHLRRSQVDQKILRISPRPCHPLLSQSKRLPRIRRQESISDQCHVFRQEENRGRKKVVSRLLDYL